MTLLLLGCIGGLSDRYVFGQDPADTDAPVVVDTGPFSSVDCDEELGSPDPGACFTGALGCGEVLHASTEGGRSDYGDVFYETAYCFVPYSAYATPERVYELVLEEHQEVEVVLASPCADMALAVARWEPVDSCPPEQDHQILECEGQPAGDWGRVRVSSPSGGRYLVIVDGPAANFELRVDCL